MGRFVFLAALAPLLGAGPRQVAAPAPTRAIALPGVGGPADRTGIPGRIDHMAYDPATKRLFVACVANGSLEAVDLVSGRRAGTVAGLRGPQGVAVSGGSVYVTTGGDGKLRRF